MTGPLEKVEFYAAKILDILCGLSLVFWARPLYSLEHEDSLEKEEVYKTKISHTFVKVKTILYQNNENNQKRENHSNYH